jgi:hypothetical protein
MENYIKYITDIYKMVEYYRTEGSINFKDIKININNNVEELYELIDFFENYILQYNAYVYDRLSQELFLKLLRTRKINGLDLILENKLEELKNITKNKMILERIEYIIANSYKINSSEKFRELILILKSLKLTNTTDLENLFFMFDKLNLIKKNKFNENDMKEILTFVSKFDLNNINKIKEEIKEMITDTRNIQEIYKNYKKEIEEIKNKDILDKIINHLDSIKN